ncbi:MAG: S-layer homology domain-containing protein [Clostridia bacterium]|nr:S-layer homology domain-containing protein [Clostridia bacterium]
MIKRSIVFILIITTLLCALPVYGAKDGIEPNGPISVMKADPLIDGMPKTNEGWSDPAVMKDSTLGYMLNDTEAGFYADTYFAVSDRGFYFAANILEGVGSYDPDDSYDSEGKNVFVPSTDEDDPSLYDEFEGTGWNGDTFMLTLDPLGRMLESGFVYDHAPRYAVSLFEDGSVRMYREMVSEGEITDKVRLVGKRTDYGWCFEACIPWEIITEDIYNISFWEVALEKKQILKTGSLIRASAIYCDRYIDSEGNIADLNHYVTAASLENCGYNIASMGLELIIEGFNLGDLGVCTPIGHDWVFDLYVEATYTSTGFGINQCSICGKIEYVTIPKKVYLDAFTDVKGSYWYADAVDYCLKHSYMIGVSSNTFAPTGKLTREQFVIILANYEGVDTSDYAYVDSGMKDVPTGRWYSGAIAWAVKEGYVSGVAPDRFGTGQDIERAALVRLLWLYTKRQGVDVSKKADLSVYADGHRVQDWMREGLEWAVYNGIISSTSDQYFTLDPKGKVSRAMAAVMIMNYDQYIHNETFE